MLEKIREEQGTYVADRVRALILQSLGLCQINYIDASNFKMVITPPISENRCGDNVLFKNVVVDANGKRYKFCIDMNGYEMGVTQ